jgi:hypothetical protein
LAARFALRGAFHRVAVAQLRAPALRQFDRLEVQVALVGADDNRVVAHRLDAVDAVAQRNLRTAAAQTATTTPPPHLGQLRSAGAIEKVAADSGFGTRSVAGRAAVRDTAYGRAVGAVAELAGLSATARSPPRTRPHRVAAAVTARARSRHFLPSLK